MLDVLQALGETGGVIGPWCVTLAPDGAIVVTASSRRTYPAQADAVSAAREIHARLTPPDHGLLSDPEAVSSWLGDEKGWAFQVKIELMSPRRRTASLRSRPMLNAG